MRTREPRSFRFWVPGPLPGQNEIIASAKGFGGRGIGYSISKAEWTERIASLAARARVPALERIRLRLHWFSTNRRRNPDNIEASQKFIWDGLVKAGVLKNDGWKQNAGSEHHHHVDPRPGVWVLLLEIVEKSRNS
jgi:hypothetical protein